MTPETKIKGIPGKQAQVLCKAVKPSKSGSQ